MLCANFGTAPCAVIQFLAESVEDLLSPIPSPSHLVSSDYIFGFPLL